MRARVSALRFVRGSGEGVVGGGMHLRLAGAPTPLPLHGTALEQQAASVGEVGWLRMRTPAPPVWAAAHFCLVGRVLGERHIPCKRVCASSKSIRAWRAGAALPSYAASPGAQAQGRVPERVVQKQLKQSMEVYVKARQRATKVGGPGRRLHPARLRHACCWVCALGWGLLGTSRIRTCLQRYGARRSTACAARAATEHASFWPLRAPLPAPAPVPLRWASS